MPRFELGNREISTAAEAVLDSLRFDAAVFFDRHSRGDWGEEDDRLVRQNEAAAQRERAWHTIRSRYRLADGLELLVITAMDRSRTRLLLAEEYRKRDIGTVEGYAAWAAFYDTVPNPLIEVEEPYMEAILDRLPAPTTAVDVGTGTGRHALRLAARGAAVTAFDACPEMLAAAREAARAQGLTRIGFERAALGEGPLPVDAGAFDLLVCALMLCHVPDLRAAVAECVRVVRPGGHLLITDFHPAAVAWGWRTAFAAPEADYQLPNAPHTRAGYLDAVTASGAEVLESHDLSLGGEPYGDLSEAAIRERGEPPLCLIIWARTPAP